MNYDSYNREERALCSHLFRLLHDNLSSNPQKSGLYYFLKVLSETGETFKKELPTFDINDIKFNNVGIFPEVALIRDKFKALKPNVNEFMNEMVKIVQKQEKKDSSLFSKLPEELRDIKRTNPQHILRKAINKKLLDREDDIKVYSEVQAMFNAKPDLVVTIDDFLFVFEAKFTEKFVQTQIERARKITEIWARILYTDLGFSLPPAYAVIKIGASRYNPDISWEKISEIAMEHYPANDRTYITFENAIKLLNNPKRSI